MAVLPFPKKDDLDDFSDLFEDVKHANDHELQLAIGAVKRPDLPFRHSHPVAGRFPGVDEVGYRDLVEDIRRNGQRKAICMYQGMIWDGRARYDACVQLGLVPRVFAFRRGDPVIYLLQRHGDRYGRPQTPERKAALAILHEIETREWKDRAKTQRTEWLQAARSEFLRQYRLAEPCAVCGMDRAYSHAHHSLPLGVQYDLGVDRVVQEHDWLCHVHHKLLHGMISRELLGAGRPYIGDYNYRYKDESARERAAQALSGLMAKARRLFEDVGGVPPQGNWAMFAP